MAIKAGVPVLPLVVNGSNACLPKHSWIFHGRHNVTLTVLPPVHTKGLTRHDVDSLTEKVRQAMYDCLKEQGVEQEKADIHGAVHPIPDSVSGDGIEKPAEAQ